MKIIENLSMEAIRALKPKTIYYGANTCWWTHDPADLRETKVDESQLLRTAENFRLNARRPNDPIDEYLERARRTHIHSLPTDPRGGVLFETNDVEAFLKAAEDNSEHYGKHGLRAFMAAHHANCFLNDAGDHWCDTDWEVYNDALDRLDKEKQ